MDIDVYGDETCGLAAVGYALLVIPRSRRATLEKLFVEVKVANGARADSEIHCSELFNEKARATSPWAHLDYQSIFELLSQVVDQLVAVQSQHVVCLADRASAANVDAESWRTADGRIADPQPPNFLPAFENDKILAVSCAGGALMEVATSLSADRLFFWPDPDGDTKVPWNLKPRWVDDILRQMWFGLPGGAAQIAIEPIGALKPPLLQIADILAFAAQRSQLNNGSETTERFADLFCRFNPVILRFAP